MNTSSGISFQGWAFAFPSTDEGIGRYGPDRGNREAEGPVFAASFVLDDGAGNLRAQKRGVLEKPATTMLKPWVKWHSIFPSAASYWFLPLGLCSLMNLQLTGGEELGRD